MVVPRHGSDDLADNEPPGAGHQKQSRFGFLPVHYIGELGISFDESGDIRTARNNCPMPLPRFVECGSNQIGGHASTAKLVRDISVIENDVRSLVDIAKEGSRSIAGCHFKALARHVVCNGE